MDIYLNSNQLQINSFKELVNAVNQIPGIKVDLSQKIDSQRDALAFMVDEIYRQFEETNGTLMLEKTIQQIRSWNTPPGPHKPTTELLKLVKHLFESRTLALLANDKINNTARANIRSLNQVYQTITNSSLLNTPKDKPVNFGGIPQELLPHWYLDKKYL